MPRPVAPSGALALSMCVATKTQRGPRSHKSKSRKPAPEPHTFFERAVPRVLSIMRVTCAELGGRYSVEVAGQGTWTLDFPEARVLPSAVEGADVIVHLSPEQFASLATGKIELRKLVADGAVRADGDASKLENVSLVLAFLERG